jgi:hypothetical protein
MSSGRSAGPGTDALVALIEDADTDPDILHSALTRLLHSQPGLGATAALGILSREPRIKPSGGLLIDPGDTVLRRWRQRVAAGRALVVSAALARVFDELYDELTDCPDLAHDVLGATPDAAALPPAQQAALAALRRAQPDASPGS